MRTPNHSTLTRRGRTACLAGLAAVASLLFAGTALAVPSQFTVQGYLTDTQGAPANGTYDVMIGLYADQTGGTAEWDESLSVVVTDGFFDAVLGATPVNPLMTEDFIDNPGLWLGVSVLAGPGVAAGGEPELPRSPLSSVGYAFAATHAISADSAMSASDLDCTSCIEITALDFDPVTQAELDAALSTGGSATADAQAAADNAQTTADDAATAAADAATAAADAATAAADAATAAAGAQTTADDAATAAAAATTAATAAQATANDAATAAGTAQTTADDAAAAAADAQTTADNLATTLANQIMALQTAVTDAVTAVTTAQAAAEAAQAAADAAQADVDALETVVAAIDVPDSVDGLAGGAITSAVSVTGDLEGTVVKQNGNIVCDASGNCGTTLANLSCTADQVIKFDGSAWVCADQVAGGNPPEACTGFNEIPHWDGTAWSCRRRDTVGNSGGTANGYPIVDDWGDAWDGIERSPKTVAEATAICEAEGGRLPTASELYRNRASAGGTGNLGDISKTTYLWTLVPEYRDGYNQRIRLSDGGRSAQPATQAHAYRCIWPSHNSAAFDGNNCYGPPGNGCQEKDHLFSFDRMERPSLDAAGAAFECRFYNASLMSVREFQEAAQQGMDNPTDQWNWVGDVAYWYNNNDGYHLVKTGAVADPHWGYDNGTNGWGDDGNLSAEGSYRVFRCIGKRDAGLGIIAADPACNGECFSLTTKRKTKIIADDTDRGALQYGEALEACRAVGGRLPTSAEFFDLLQSGWTNGSNEWLWSSDAMYWYNDNYGVSILRWSGTGVPGRAHYNDSGTVSRADSNRRFRCVWTERLEETMTACDADENQIWDAAAQEFSCEAAVDGVVDNDVSNPPGVPAFPDAWGNKWDFFQRADMTYIDAVATCEGLGGRLPTATEVWRVRHQQGVVGSELGQSTDTEWIWTNVPSAEPAHNMVMKLANGDVSHAHNANAEMHNVRCIWPTTKGDALTGRSCNGDPTAAGGGCFTDAASGLRADAYNRPPLYNPSAAWECNFYGGRLPDHNEYASLIHGGLANNSNTWLHIAEAEYWYNGGYGTNIIRWDDDTVDRTKWAFNKHGSNPGHTGSLTWETTRYNFRCVYSNEIR